MTDTPSAAIKRFGTEEPVAPPQVLKAGPLTAELEAGNLRYIRFHGAEVLRAVSFIVRDKDWGTYSPAISNLKVDEKGERFSISYDAVATEGADQFSYSATIEGDAQGRLTFRGWGESETGFLTNRTGFVILHPIDGVAGAPVTITHTDGREVDSVFPKIIDPVQPMMDLRALTHVTPSGLTVKTLMEGDTYEMEDQRNWTDASYKTYVRPLAKPWPYRIEPGERLEQTITVTISGTVVRSGATEGAPVAAGEAIGPVPPLGLGLRAEDVDATMARIDVIRQIAPAHLILHFDPRAGHSQESLARQLDVARALSAEPWLEAVIASVEDGTAAAEVKALGEMAEALGSPFATVLVSPGPDLKCTLPGSPWPQTPDAGRLYAATRDAFPGVRLGGGMFSYFTELNRKRPPAGTLDLISFTTSPLVHAGDDRSVMETREAHPAIVASVSAIADGTSWAVGPSAIGVRDNPYGEAAKDNPENTRQAMNYNDPRQRGLFGAVWALGYFADFARGGASAVSLGSPVGAFGAAASKMTLPQPFFDAQRDVYPVFHILRGLARLRDRTIHALPFVPAGPLNGIAVESEEGIEFWVGNTRPQPTELTFAGSGAAVALLDDASFERAARASDHMDQTVPLPTSTLMLGPHAIARIHLPN